MHWESGKVVFVHHDESASRVSVSGEFNGWNPAHGAFSRTGEGDWRFEMAAPAPGRYRYKLLIDDTRWIEDPSHDVTEPNPYGGLDSVLVVE